MPLTHVCVWEPKIGYRRVSIREACEMYPNGVHARSGCFVCELCGQNVLLTAPGINVQHFRHDSASPNKECDERQLSFDPTYGRKLFGLNSYVVPLKIVVNSSNFMMQLGFFYPPDKSACCDRIKIVGDSDQSFEYSFERIEKEGTTYLNVGYVPCKEYNIEFINANTALKKYWANKVTGVSSLGTFFDVRNGHILLPGAKANSENSYYLLQRQRLYTYTSDIEVTEICKTNTSNFTTWYLYKVQVKRFSESSAKFFLKRSIFLTERPTRVYPIWPTYVKEPHFIYHNSNVFYFYLCGDDAELKAYPPSREVLKTDDGKLYKLYTRGREQLISLGKSGAQGFSYLIKQQFNKKVSLPNIHISDHFGNELIQEMYDTLPKLKYIIILSQYDGKAVIYQNKKIKNIYKITSEQNLIIDSLSYGTEIEIYCGCDCIRTLRFECSEERENIYDLDNSLVRKLKMCNGPKVPITHAFGAIIQKYELFPQTKQWIYNVLKSGEITRKAYRLLIADTSTDYRRN